MSFQFDGYVGATLLRGLPGLAAVMLLARGHVQAAGAALVMAVWVDAATGWIARRRDWEKGQSVTEVEVLVDFLCFVWGPAQFALALAAHTAVLAGVAVFVLAGVFRLARFKVEGLVRGGYRGLPVTYNGYILPLAGVATHYLDAVSVPLLTAVLFIVAALMASSRLVVPAAG